MSRVAPLSSMVSPCSLPAVTSTTMTAGAGGQKPAAGGGAPADASADPPLAKPTLDGHDVPLISAEDLKATLAAGHTEDEVFEAVVAASLGAGLRRLEKAMGAIAAAREETR